MGLLHKSKNLETRVSNSSIALTHKGTEQLSGSSREYDTAKWAFSLEHKEMPNLAFMPIIAIIILVLCSLLRAYKWSQGRDLWKAQVNVEFSEETEENISSIGNRDISPSENLSDGGSFYDTVSSFRLLDNGYAVELNEGHPYHDTVTSYKSLLLQKADGSQYDSVQSYKAFLQKLTHNKDLAVEVKLLENYPIHSKSAEHCVVLEEESSERSGEVSAKILGHLPAKKRSGEVSAKMIGALPVKRQLHKDCRLPQFEKNKCRHRRASGDTPAGMRKRSASNPTYRRATNKVGSLPSVRYIPSLSSDSEEDTKQSLRIDRKQLWAERRKISRSASGGKMSKDNNSSSLSNGHCSSEALVHGKRVRHFSADGVQYHRQATSRNRSKIDADLRRAQKTQIPLLKVTIRGEKSSVGHTEESSSENPASSHSSDSDVLSDMVVSDNDDETKRNTLLSTASDDQTLDNDVFFSLDSGTELVSSSEILQHSPKPPLSETKILIARAKEDFFKSQTSHTLMPPTEVIPKKLASDVENQISDTWTDVVSIIIDNQQASNLSSSTSTRNFVHSQQGSKANPGSYSQQRSDLSPSSHSQQDFNLSPSSHSQQRSDLSPSSHSQQESNLSPSSHSQQESNHSPSSHSQQEFNLSPSSHSQQRLDLDTGSQSPGVCTVNKLILSTGSQGVHPGIQVPTLDTAASDESKNLSSPQKVQRFHVTHVSNDIPSLHSE